MSREKIHELLMENGKLWIEKMKEAMDMTQLPLMPEKQLNKVISASMVGLQEKLKDNYKALVSEIDETISALESLIAEHKIYTESLLGTLKVRQHVENGLVVEKTKGGKKR